jgi:hypothetical protein
MLEGYWTSRYLAPLFLMGVWWQQKRHRRFTRRLGTMKARTSIGAALTRERRARASDALRTRFPSESRLLPTALGNALRSAEDRAGQRYGIDDAITLWARLYWVIPAEAARAIENEVIQLDLSARLCMTWFFTGSVSAAILATDITALHENPTWLLLVGMLFVSSWLSYRGAIESALAHGSDLEVAIDLYRDFLLDAARYGHATLLSQESRRLARLCKLYSSRNDKHGVDHRLYPRVLTLPTPSPGPPLDQPAARN